MQSKSEYLESFFKNAATGIAIIGADGNIISVNPYFTRLSGYTPAELNSISFMDLTHPENKPEEKKTLSELFSGKVKSSSSEKRIISKDGKSIWVSQTLTQAGDHRNQTVIIANLEDITLRKDLEQEQKKELEINTEFISLFNSIFDAIPDIIGIQNTNHELIRYNAAGYSFLGKSHAEIVGKKCYNLIGRKEKCEVCSTSECLITKMPEQHQQFFPEYNVWLDMRSYPIFNSKGEITYIIEHLRDITAIKNIEMSLVRSKEKAEESDRLKSSFLANMSHEIRTPMNGILGFAELLRDPSLPRQEAIKYIEIIRKSGDRMLNILNDLIDVSKIEAGETVIKNTSFNMNHLLLELYDFYKPDTEHKGLSFIYKTGLPDDEALINTDKNKLTEIFSNLIDNAIKFTGRGTVEIGYEHKNDFIEFYVSDTGTGITSEQKKVIFDRFRQGSESLSRNYEGAGLGLYISKKYIEILGGQIRVENNFYSSVEGPGSKFCFTIPQIPTDQDLINKNDTGNKKNEKNHLKIAGKLKILIAEDDEPSLLFLRDLLQPMSSETMYAGSGVEAVELCMNNPGIDLVLMDIKLAKMDGYEATRQIRHFNKDVIIIAQTAFALPGDRELAIDAGCNDYLVKPIRQGDLISVLNKYFNTGTENKGNTVRQKKQL